jgi:hypothetical protein
MFDGPDGISPAAHPRIVSNFATGLDGWTVGDIASATSTAPDPANPPTFNAKGGDKGGYISTFDTENIVAFLAPAQYTGNLSGYYGGSLSFDAQDKDGAESGDTAVVVIYGDGTSITYAGLPPGTTWTHYDIPLTQTGWTFYPGGQGVGTTPVTRAQFRAILADVTDVAIEADWQVGPDNSGLDSVVLAGKPKAAASPPGAHKFVDAAASLGGGFADHAQPALVQHRLATPMMAAPH